MDQALHVQKSGGNEGFARWVESTRPQSTDWTGIAYFYSALHLIDAYLHRYVGDKEYKNHKERWAALQPRYLPPPLPEDQLRHYQSLYVLGRRARYEELSIDDSYLKGVIQRHYEPLMQFLRPRLAAERRP